MFVYHVYPDFRLCVFTGRGVLTADQIKAVSGQMLQDPEWETGWNILFDLRTAVLSDLDYQRMRTAVAKDRSFNGRVAGAKFVIVADDDLTYGLMRMWQSMSEDRPIEIRIFRRIEDALQALGVDDPGAVGC